jgi:uncharacterized protein YuzE
MMRPSDAPEADAKCEWFAPEGKKSVSTTEVAPGIVLDSDAAGNVIDIEVLNVRKRVAEQRNNRRAPRDQAGNGNRSRYG